MKIFEPRFVLLFAVVVVGVAACKGADDDPTPYMTTNGKAPRSKMAGAGGGGGPAAAKPASASPQAAVAKPSGNEPAGKKAGKKPEEKTPLKANG